MKIKKTSGMAILAAGIIVAGIVTVFATSAPNRAEAAAEPRDLEAPFPVNEPMYRGESTTALMPIDLTFSESDAGIPELIAGLNASKYRAVYVDNELCLRVTDAGAVQIGEDGGAAWKEYGADTVDAKDFAEWLLQNDPIPGYSMNEMQSRLENGAEVKHVVFDGGKEMYFVADSNRVQIELVQPEKSASVLIDGQRMMITSVRYNPYIISSNMLRSFYDLLVSCGIMTKSEAERDCAARTAWIESAEGFVISEDNSAIPPADRAERNAYSTDKTDVLEGKSYIDLTQQKSLQVNAQELSNCQLYTNSTKITISIPGGNYEGEFLLYDVQNDSAFIQSFTLNRNNRTRTFFNLTSVMNYYIATSGIDDDVMITISD